MAKKIAPSEILKNRAKIVRINFVRTLENSQRFTATRKILNQKAGNLKNGRKALWHFHCPWPNPTLPSGRWQPAFSAWNPGSWFQREQSRP